MDKGCENSLIRFPFVQPHGRGFWTVMVPDTSGKETLRFVSLSYNLVFSFSCSVVPREWLISQFTSTLNELHDCTINTNKETKIWHVLHNNWNIKCTQKWSQKLYLGLKRRTLSLTSWNGLQKNQTHQPMLSHVNRNEFSSNNQKQSVIHCTKKMIFFLDITRVSMIE